MSFIIIARSARHGSLIVKLMLSVMRALSVVRSSTVVSRVLLTVTPEERNRCLLAIPQLCN